MHGSVTAFGGKPPVAILESKAYLVYTPTRGILRGLPMLVESDRLTSAEDFEAP
jgi:hypothetical protein